MAIGLILKDDTVEVFALDREIEKNDQNQLQLDTMQDFDLKAYTNVKENSTMEYLSTDDIARRLLEYDHVLAY